ncbi:MAG: amidohydrolase family protein [Planctomycetes bacterium]|nr:amidohydrolase family protein [Planctomycetota bacterium]
MIDAHHHFWQLDRYDYVWMSPDLQALYRDFGPDDLQPSLSNHNITSTVLVQTISSVDETRWFLELANQHATIAGVVGWVDLTDCRVSEQLDELGDSRKFVGVRHQVHDEPDPDWLARADVQHGLGEMARRSLTYDLLIRPQHLEVSLRVAQKFPELRFVIDHIAKPEIAKHGWDDWATGIAALAACPNVACKLSGMITEADWTHWQPTDLAPYIQHLLEHFGTDRVMFGSDWPVCLLAGTYDQVVDALATNLDQLSDREKQDVFGKTAIAWYDLEAD